MIVLKPDTAALAERLATASGETVEQAVRTAIVRRARELGVSVGPDDPRDTGGARPNLERMTRIARRAATRPLLDVRAIDDIMDYDEHGLPR
jgi:hypothetical protein